MTNRFGGSFAPPLTDEKLAAYKALIDAQPASHLKDALNTVLACSEAWWVAPESTGKGIPHPSGSGFIVDLDAEIAKSLFDVIPWKQELDMFQTLFDGIDNSSERALRDAAFHLLWHARELENDREPITHDKL